jgi:hypothetical protein
MSDPLSRTKEAEEIVRRFDLAVLDGDLDLAMTLARSRGDPPCPMAAFEISKPRPG